MASRTTAVLIAGGLALLTGGCLDSTAPGLGVASIDIALAADTVVPGTTVQATATPRNAHGAEILGAGVIWLTSDTTVATVNDAGLISAVGRGTVEIAAQSGHATGHTVLRVDYPSCTTEPIAGTLSLTDSAANSITNADCLLVNFYLADAWRVTVTSPTMLKVSMASAAFAPRLFITDQNLLLYGSDASSGLDAATDLYASLPPGTYTIWATSYGSPLGRGAYTLSTTRIDLCSDAAAVGSIAPGDSVASMITTASCQIIPRLGAEVRRVSVTSGTGVAFDLHTDAFEPLLFITEAVYPYLVVAVGEAHTATDAEALAVLVPGEYLVWAMAADGGTGAYGLAMREYSVFPCAGPGATLALRDTTLRGTLQAGDCEVPWGAFADRWTLTLPDSAFVGVYARGTSVAPFLLLQDSTGSVVALSAYLNAVTGMIELPLAAGAYHVVVSTTNGATTLPYEIYAATAEGGALRADERLVFGHDHGDQGGIRDARWTPQRGQVHAPQSLGGGAVGHRLSEAAVHAPARGRNPDGRGFPARLP